MSRDFKKSILEYVKIKKHFTLCCSDQSPDRRNALLSTFNAFQSSAPQDGIQSSQANPVITIFQGCIWHFYIFTCFHTDIHDV